MQAVCRATTTQNEFFDQIEKNVQTGELLKKKPQTVNTPFAVVLSSFAAKNTVLT